MLIEKMLGPVDWENTKLFVEYGPGVGTFTRPILDKLGPDATLVDDRHQLRLHQLSCKESIDDPRLVAVTGSAADVEKILADRGFAHADYVLSGLPFSTLPPGVGDAIGEGDRARSSARAAHSWSISSAPRCATSSSRTSTGSTAASNGSTSRRPRCSGPGRTNGRKRLTAQSPSGLKFSRRVTL